MLCFHTYREQVKTRVEELQELGTKFDLIPMVPAEEQGNFFQSRFWREALPKFPESQASQDAEGEPLMPSILTVQCRAPMHVQTTLWYCSCFLHTVGRLVQLLVVRLIVHEMAITTMTLGYFCSVLLLACRVGVPKPSTPEFAGPERGGALQGIQEAAAAVDAPQLRAPLCDRRAAVCAHQARGEGGPHLGVRREARVAAV